MFIRKNQWAYYNDNDPFACQWVRELIKQKLIAPGEVDERPIQEVDADDVRGFIQCHWFCGIAGWSLALRMAGWDDSRPVFTGSCPCQPFSAAGKRAGTADARHLWPEFYRLIRECRPPVAFGEQVASRLGREWLAGVFADLESVGYAVAGADLCAASAGAPHIRQRLWWVADADQGKRGWVADGEGRDNDGPKAGWQQGNGVAQPSGETGRLANTDPAGQRLERISGLLDGEWAALGHDADGCGEVCGLGDADGLRLTGERGSREAGATEPGGDSGLGDSSGPRLAQRVSNAGIRPIEGCAHEGQAAELSGPWSNYEWIPCADGKARRIEPSIVPLVDGLPQALDGLGPISRVGALKGAGNAIVPQVAAEFIKAAL